MLSSYVPHIAEMKIITVPIRDLSTRRVDAQKQAPAALLVEKGPCAHCTGGWVGLETGLETGLDGCGKFPLQGSELRTVQLVTSCCINYAIPAVMYVLSNLPFVARKSFSALRVVWLE
jgi:hypothetical protein